VVNGKRFYSAAVAAVAITTDLLSRTITLAAAFAAVIRITVVLVVVIAMLITNVYMASSRRLTTNF
jgi:hypothetical protein